MIMEYLDKNLLIILLFGLAVLISYRLFFMKTKDIIELEKEYHKVLNDDQHKVKGQYD